MFFLAVCALFAHAQSNSGVEARKIEYLIGEIQALQGAVFVRNGIAYDALSAAKHLRMKWRAAGSHVATAEDFIRVCASGSSVSGLPYTIHFADGHSVTSEQFMRDKLTVYAPLPLPDG